MQIKNLGAQMSVGIKGKLKKGRKGGVKTEEVCELCNKFNSQKF